MSDEKPRHDHDRVRPILQTGDGHVLALRCNNGEKEVLALKRAEEGKPLHHELVSLSKASDAPGEYEMKSVYKPTGATSTGPAKVSSDAYRSGWEAIFGAKRASPN
jgi:hypothetical protein